VEHGRCCAELATRMIGSVNAFLDGSFGDGGANAHASVNECLGALGRFFQGAERWSAEGKRVVLRDLISDTRVPCAPLELMNGLKHLAEYSLVRAKSETRVSLAAAVLLAPEPLAGRLAGAACVLNRDSIRRDRPHVSFRLSAPLPAVSVEAIQSDFAAGGENARTGNLSVLSKVLVAVRGCLLIDRNAAGTLTLEPLLPVSL
jgi:hypothetical protein